jgi:phytanoyl-CoA hydroxylase
VSLVNLAKPTVPRVLSEPTNPLPRPLMNTLMGFAKKNLKQVINALPGGEKYLESRRIRTARWKEVEAELPWFEQRNALQHLDTLVATHGLSEEERGYLHKWVCDGYFIVEDCIDQALIQKFSNRIEDAWTTNSPIPGLQVSDVVLNGNKNIHTQHEDLIRVPLAERMEAKRISNWRIGEYHLYEESAKQIFQLERLKRLSSLVFGREAHPHFSLTFSKGSQQLLHQDTCVFHVWPRNYLIGVWIAAEDIHPASGPLVYYPGSHREPLFPEFDNYPQTQRRTSPQAQSDRYDDYVRKLAEKYQRTEFTPKAGTALFWHGMLIHGGSVIKEPDRSRKSFVIHYIPDGCNVAGQVQGPFNW